ncbi:MAG TPA: S8 family serine peptidase [Solimonas sp.]|nr:S8 family serine peptidase [Solimonas sp.]
MLPSFAKRARAGVAIVVCLAAAACGRGFGDEDLPKDLPQATAAVTVGPSLQQRLAAMGPDDTAEVIVSFRGKQGVTPQQVQMLRDMGFKGIYMRHLPIAGVVARRTQIEALLRMPEMVRSLWHNDTLQYDNEDARYLSSVDRAQEQPELVNQAGEPITGKGVTILVNDSGIDGLHGDLMNKVAVNAYGHTDLKGLTENDMLPATPTECPVACNTDVGGSHGSHVSGIAAGDGARSGGRFRGAASGATLAGIGSGATLLVLNTLGGFDFALTLVKERPELNLRIVTNSFGSTGDQGTEFVPDDPTNIATKMLADLGIIVVFSAGNSGSGPSSITGNFKKAPWILIAANGEKSGLLAPSSSRGALTNAVYPVTVDGEVYSVEDRPTVVTAGTNIISVRAVAADPFTPLDLADDQAAGDLTPEQLPFYTHKTGTSMAAPHLAGLVALLLEANPELGWREVKEILKTTATNMPGYEPWEVGAGFANVEAALAMALDRRQDYGAVNHGRRTFKAAIALKNEPILSTESLQYLPQGLSSKVEFEASAEIGLVAAIWDRPDDSSCSCSLVLIDPAGKEYRSSVGLPVLAPRVSAVGNGRAGTWTLTVSGLRSLSGVDVDPAHNGGTSAPATIEVQLYLYPKEPARGLGDIVGHPEQKLIEAAVYERLMDGVDAGFAPAQPLTRAQFAEYLMAWGVRQTRAHTPAQVFADLGSDPLTQAAAEALGRVGQLILSRSTASLPLLRNLGTSFNAGATVSREEVGYALVQAIGRQAAAEAASGALMATTADGTRVEVVDADTVDPLYLGHVQVALDLGLLTVELFEEGGALKARLAAKTPVTRLEYARAAMAAFAAVPFP